MPRFPASRIRFATLLCLALVPAFVKAGALTDLLIAQVGVSQSQADGGAGSIFKLARVQMTPENFQKLRTVVPGLDTYLGAAPVFLPNEAPATGARSGAGQTAALTGLAGGGSAQGAQLASLAGGGSAKGAAITGLAGGGPTSNALAAAALGQAPSPADALQGAARNKLSQSLGAVVPGRQAGVAVGALGANVGGSPTAIAASALLAGTTLGDKLQAAQALVPAFQRLGMDESMVARFLPVVVDYVKSVGGKSSSRLLTHALGI